jgi:hypothetical protein
MRPVAAESAGLGGKLPKCFRCLGRGHWQYRCPSSRDFSLCCFNCGMQGHRYQKCRRAERCNVCALRGFSSAHRSGSRVCPPIQPGLCGGFTQGEKPGRPPAGPSGSVKEAPFRGNDMGRPPEVMTKKEARHRDMQRAMQIVAEWVAGPVPAGGYASAAAGPSSMVGRKGGRGDSPPNPQKATRQGGSYAHRGLLKSVE